MTEPKILFAGALDLTPFSRTPRLIKRLLDIGGAVVGIVFAVPLGCLVAFAIKLEDGGPIIHFRRVVGCKGEFNAFKFRSMKPNADQILQDNEKLRAEFVRSFKLKDDPRVTRVGRFLRRTSIDELPQLINVLRGQMSLVGPRMITSQELARYGAYQAMLLKTRPGITGYWQVYGRQRTSYEERVRMDISYIRGWSLWVDLRLLCQTVHRVVKGEGAY